jgi:NAD(P)H-flavin reductase
MITRTPWLSTATIAFDLPKGSVYPLTKMEQPKLLIAGEWTARGLNPAVLAAIRTQVFDASAPTL